MYTYHRGRSSYAGSFLVGARSLEPAVGWFVGDTQPILQYLAQDWSADDDLYYVKKESHIIMAGKRNSLHLLHLSLYSNTGAVCPTSHRLALSLPGHIYVSHRDILHTYPRYVLT